MSKLEENKPRRLPSVTANINKRLTRINKVAVSFRIKEQIKKKQNCTLFAQHQSVDRQQLTSEHSEAFSC